MFNYTINTIVKALNYKRELAFLNVIKSYPNSFMPIPLNKPTLCIGVGNIEISSVCMGDYLGESDNGKKGQIQLNCCLYSPKNKAIGLIYESYYKVCNYLLFSESFSNNHFFIKAINSKSAKYDESTLSYFMEFTITAELYLKGDDYFGVY